MRAPRVLSIGALGHQVARLPPRGSSGWQAIGAELLSLLKCLADAVAARADTQPVALHIFGSLASGADQLIAAAALDASRQSDVSFLLHTILPFPPAQYGCDMAPEDRQELERLVGASAEVEIVTDGHDEAAAYRAAADRMRTSSDLLLAVWDGGPSAGPGSTTETVLAALDQAMPVLWLHPARPACVRLLRARSDLAASSMPASQNVLTALVAGLLPRAAARRLAAAAVPGYPDPAK